MPKSQTPGTNPESPDSNPTIRFESEQILPIRGVISVKQEEAQVVAVRYYNGKTIRIQGATSLEVKTRIDKAKQRIAFME